MCVRERERKCLCERKKVQSKSITEIVPYAASPCCVKSCAIHAMDPLATRAPCCPCWCESTRRTEPFATTRRYDFSVFETYTAKRGVADNASCWSWNCSVISCGTSGANHNNNICLPAPSFCLTASSSKQRPTQGPSVKAESSVSSPRVSTSIPARERKGNSLFEAPPSTIWPSGPGCGGTADMRWRRLVRSRPCVKKNAGAPSRINRSS